MPNPIHLLYVIVVLGLGTIAYNFATTYSDSSTGIAECLKSDSPAAKGCVERAAAPLLAQSTVIKAITTSSPPAQSAELDSEEDKEEEVEPN